MPTFVRIEFNGLRLSLIHKFELSVASTISLGISSALLIISLGVVSVVVRPVGAGSWNRDPAIRARLKFADFRLNHCGCGGDAAKIVRREFQDSNSRTEKILLIPDILIGSDEKIELAGRQCQ